MSAWWEGPTPKRVLGLAREITKTTGTGAYVLEGAVADYARLRDVVGDEPFRYVAWSGDTGQLERGIGRLVADGWTLTRERILVVFRAEPTGPINWISGTKAIEPAVDWAIKPGVAALFGKEPTP